MTIAITSRRHGFERLLTVFTAIAVLIGLAVLLVPAARADTFTLALSFQVVRGNAGSEHILYDGPMPVSGELCSVTASDAGNNRSVHPDNDLRLESNGQVVNFFDVERAPNVSTPGDQSIVPGATGTVTLTLGGDGVYSADLVLDFGCEPVTTTTVPETTTTVPETTTTVPETTTTVPETTTIIPDEVLPTVITTTTAPDEVLPAEVLPFTGLEDESLWILGLALLGAGITVIVAAKGARQTDE